MKTKTLITIITVFAFSSCGPTIYKANNFESSKRTMKTVAILPFTVSVDSKRLPKGITVETLKTSEQKTGYDMQNASYTWFLQRQKNYTITFQDVDKTNALLQKVKIPYDSIGLQDKGELCRLLGVDGILTGKATMSKPMSEGAAVTLFLLAGAYGSTNKTTVTLSIHDSKSDLLWKYDYVANGGIGSSSESLTKALMKNASKNIPYKTQ